MSAGKGASVGWTRRSDAPSGRRSCLETHTKALHVGCGSHLVRRTIEHMLHVLSHVANARTLQHLPILYVVLVSTDG